MYAVYVPLNARTEVVGHGKQIVKTLRPISTLAAAHSRSLDLLGVSKLIGLCFNFFIMQQKHKSCI
jgi:hypothetical protein